MATILDKPSTQRPISKVSIPPQTAISKPDQKYHSKQYNIYSIVTKYTKSWLFVALISFLIIFLLVASYILLQISKSRTQSKLLSPVPSYRSITLP
jgi:pilus assembly protein TadC